MPYYTVTEPHPTVAQSAWTHAGRGGAGNHFRAPPTTSPQGIPTPLLQPTVSRASTASSSSSGSQQQQKPQRFYSGRGGAGNAQRQQPDFNPVTSFEDEFSRADTRHRVEMGSGYHVGRGGAGNVKSGSTSSSKKERQGSANSGASCSSSGSSRSSILSRLGFKR